ncbi:hypothetical protein PMAYCL1PPCAC_29185 [Pristionchus mayeri]|uniref:Uncharacterized protein n=1 Tax=Pristionchus mayeri TaxID=1317129 RepID=A0AAN5DB92_9BILA|nr:hypothetical protein PMAYCL1PPCAC_29185 [Pristionchus mayeri]
MIHTMNNYNLLQIRGEVLWWRVDSLQILEFVLLGLHFQTGKGILSLRAGLSVKSVLGVSLDGCLECDDRFILLAGGLLGGTEVVQVGGRESGLDGLSLLEGSDGGRVVLVVELLHTEEVEGVGVLGVNGDGLLEVLVRLSLVLRLLLELGEAGEDIN